MAHPIARLLTLLTPYILCDVNKIIPQDLLYLSLGKINRNVTIKEGVILPTADFGTSTVLSLKFEECVSASISLAKALWKCLQVLFLIFKNLTMAIHTHDQLSFCTQH